ncbi:MAG: maleylacetoacetate isomerase [Burkholderiaceae bacterium]|nr:maleylacetoacetate isomerase [Burkholderiaceae bacterium]
MKLYNFWRSGTSHRTRIALNLKGISTEYLAVHLGKNAHLSDDFKAVNPQQLVPALVLDEAESGVAGGYTLIQSPAIIEWLEEAYPTPALLPTAPFERATVRAMAAVVGCDVHPINNKRILDYLRQQFGADEAAINAWCGTWIGAGFDALEALIAQPASEVRYCFGNAPTLADVYLIPQVESARRFKVNLSRWPKIAAIDAHCATLAAFANAAPGKQPDAA